MLRLFLSSRHPKLNVDFPPALFLWFLLLSFLSLSVLVLCQLSKLSSLVSSAGPFCSVCGSSCRFRCGKSRLQSVSSSLVTPQYLCDGAITKITRDPTSTGKIWSLFIFYLFMYSFSHLFTYLLIYLLFTYLFIFLFIYLFIIFTYLFIYFCFIFSFSLTIYYSFFAICCCCPRR